MGSSGGIGIGTRYVLDGGDGDLVGCCDECVVGVDGGNDNDKVGCDDGAVDGVSGWGCIGTDEFGADGSVVGLVEGRNVGNVEVYSRWDQVDEMVAMIMVVDMA